ncbi:MAG: hypothetical protein OXE50_06745 [Chloroflexi bacterium]|nr:hypothetical protein [Chloroflexota bacterium]
MAASFKRLSKKQRETMGRFAAQDFQLEPADPRSGYRLVVKLASNNATAHAFHYWPEAECWIHGYEWGRAVHEQV